MLYLQRKYPLVRHKINPILIISLGISLMIYILQPFSFDLYPGSKFGASLGFGGITFLCLLFFNYFIKRKIAKQTKKWTILFEILYIIGLILTITIFNFLYFSMILMDFSFNVQLFLLVIYFTFFIGLIPAVILILVKYNRYLNGQLSTLIDIKEEECNFEITISNQLSRDKDLIININDFLFAEANKNNVEIYYLQNDEVKSKTIRSTITTVEEEINYPNIFRCHRSFIVNLKKIESANGNSNGYQIKLKNSKNPIPVSRKYVNDFKQLVY